jgi:O-antigen ligase
MLLARFIYRNGTWLLGSIVLLLLFPTPLSAIGFFLVPVFFLCRRLVTGDWLPRNRVNFVILTLLTMTAIGFAISPAPDLAVLTAATFVAGITIFFFLLDHLQKPPDFTRVVGIVVFLGLCLALVVPFITEPSLDPILGSFALTISSLLPKLPRLSNQNIVAGGLAIVAPLALALIAQSTSERWRKVGIVSLPVICFAILFLESRGAMFALAAGFAAWLTLYRRWVLPFIPLVVIAVLLLNEARHGPSIGQVLYGSIGYPKSGTFIERTAIWSQATYLIRQSPLTGIGLGAYPRIAPFAFPYSIDVPGPAPNHAHNLFLQIALDTGVIGGVAFIALVLYGLYSTWRAYRVRIERDLAIGLLAAFVVLLVHGLGDTIVWGTSKASVILWALLGLGISFTALQVKADGARETV